MFSFKNQKINFNLNKVIISRFFCFFLVHLEEKYMTIEFFLLVFLFQTRITSCIFPADWRLQWQGAHGIGWWIYSNLLFHGDKFFYTFQIHIKIYLEVHWTQLFSSMPKKFSKKNFFLGLIKQDIPLKGHIHLTTRNKMKIYEFFGRIKKDIITIFFRIY